MEKRPLILLTGFNAFAGLPANPSELIVREIERGGAAGDYDLGCEVLPTEFGRAGQGICRLIGDHEPNACICVGVNTKASAVMLERFAVNVDDARCADNAGERPCGCSIVEGGPAAYRATLPLEEMAAALGSCGVPVGYSNHAGAFVCNHVFYRAAHAAELGGVGTRVGFIHVPWPADLGTIADGCAAGLTLADLVRGVRACVGAVAAVRPQRIPPEM